MKTLYQTDDAPAPVGPYSQAVGAGGFVFCSGQIAIDPKTNEVLKVPIPEQTKRVMENIRAVLTRAGLGFEHIVKTTIFLTDMNDFADVNAVYETYFKAQPPARSTIAVLGLPKGVRVEIEVIAYKS